MHKFSELLKEGLNSVILLVKKKKGNILNLSIFLLVQFFISLAVGFNCSLLSGLKFLLACDFMYNFNGINFFI